MANCQTFATQIKRWNKVTVEEFEKVIRFHYLIVWHYVTFKDELTKTKCVLINQDCNSLRLMPCPFTGPKMFFAGPNFLSQPKNLTAFSASSKTFVPAQKTILLNANHLFVWYKMFVTPTICK